MAASMSRRTSRRLDACGTVRALCGQPNSGCPLSIRSITLSAQSPEGSNLRMSVTIQVRVDETVKNEAALVLADAGLNLSTAVWMFLVRVARERALPFDPFDNAGPFPPPPHAPNEETIAAIRAAERGELVRIGHPSNLIADLDAD